MNDSLKGVPRQDPNSDASDAERLTADEEERRLERERAKHERDQLTRHVIGISAVCLIILIVCVIGAAIFVLAWHMLAPESKRWLSTGDLDSVKGFMLSGALVGLGTAYMRRFME